MNDYSEPQVAFSHNLHGAKVLLIEDNLDQQRLIQEMLQVAMPEVKLLAAVTVEESFN